MTLKEVSVIAGVGFKKYSMDCNSFFMFSLERTEVKERGLLIGVFGRGKTRTAAKQNYAKQLCGRVIVVNARRGDRREFQLPPFVTAK